MKMIPDNSVDSVVCDPPYGLSFMGKHWDYDVPTVDVWREVLRVLKPGGHLLSFFGTRTYHRGVVAIEDAGFEIRDQIQWIYASGFPKSLNIGKAVDKLQGNERVKVDSYRTGDGANFKHSGNGKEQFHEAEAKEIDITKGTSPWEGWGTALKPANEPIVVARKPLGGKSVAENVLKWGTGGINVDGCRIPANWKAERPESWFNSGTSKGGSTYGGNLKTITDSTVGDRLNDAGRFPANLIHDGSPEVLSLFPNTKSGKMKQHIEGGEFNVFGKQYPRNVETIGDSGSASRFFYCAKASKRDRNEGCEGLEEKVRVRQRLTGEHKDTVSSNSHPTVKPTDLMRYLCRLVTPKGGTVLDPFMGSGSTGKAAKLEGFDFIGIEREAEYVKIAEARINAVKPESKLL